MWKRLLNKLKGNKEVPRKKKRKNGIQVHATKEGDLYIKVSDLFSQPHVQELVLRMAKSDLYKPK